MMGRHSGAPCGLRFGLLGLAASVACVAVSADPADARGWRRHVSRHATTQPAQNEARYADIVIDANTGAVLHSTNPDALRHPASLTKIMTLYLLFERLEAGKLKLDSQLDVSAHAASQSPTKLGLRAGETIKVEDAIKGIVTRSANDAAVVVAENVADSEEEFARMMTRKAQALGMSRTVYKNANGLPNDAQVTTARDQSILGRAIQERFPRYYPYFSTRTFLYRGHAIGNHNHLLGRIEGVDGIKTGYINASGFNIVTSVHRGNRYLVAAVFGGGSAGSRDARMQELINGTILTASTQRIAPMVAELYSRGEPKAFEPKVVEQKIPEPKVAEAKPAQTAKVAQGFVPASASSTPIRLDPVATAPLPAARVTTGSTEPIRPVPVKTFLVRPGANVQTASIAALYLPSAPPTAEVSNEAAAPASAKTEMPSVVRPAAAPPTRVASASVTAPLPPSKPQQTHTGWIVQVGA